MKVEWTAQVKTDTAAEALDLAMAKWWFFAHCTKKQFAEYSQKLKANCSLCLLSIYDDDDMADCQSCVMGQYNNDINAYKCHALVLEAVALSKRVVVAADLTQFHAAARKVYDKLKSLRGKV